MALLEEYHRTQKLIFSGSCSHLRNSYTWKEFKIIFTEWTGALS